MAKKKMKSKKGVAGKNTGGKARKGLRKVSRCMTNAEIGRKIGRDASTVSAIRNGAIKNPPAALIARINKLSC